MIGSLALQILFFTLFFVFCTYACIIADPDTSDVARIFTRTVPSFLFQRLEIILGKQQLKKIEKLLDHGLQIVYLVVVLGSWSIVFFYGYPQIERSKYIHSYHQYTGYVVFILCMGSWHFACQQSPGNVTARTIPLFDHYEYDDVLYTNRICPTLKIRKVARSKYDRFTKKHVPRFDHFCGWLNQAVGEQNYRWFLLFLSVHVLMCFYGSWAFGSVLYGVILERDLLNASFFNAITGAEVKADYFVVFHYLFMRYFELCGVLILTTVMAVVLGSFLFFHLYITSRNMTTNEFFKWRSVRKWHKQEKLKYEQALKHGKIKSDFKENLKKSSKAALDVDVGCTGPIGEDSSSDMIGDDEIFDPGPLPHNIYNKGIAANFSEVFFPLSLRDDAIQRFRTTLQNKSGFLVTDEGASLPEEKVKPKTI